MDIRESLRQHVSRRPTVVEEQTLLSYYNVDDNQYEVADVKLAKPEIIDPYTIYRLNRFFQ